MSETFVTLATGFCHFIVYGCFFVLFLAAAAALLWVVGMIVIGVLGMVAGVLEPFFGYRECRPDRMTHHEWRPSRLSKDSRDLDFLLACRNDPGRLDVRPGCL